MNNVCSYELVNKNIKKNKQLTQVLRKRLANHLSFYTSHELIWNEDRIFVLERQFIHMDKMVSACGLLLKSFKWYMMQIHESLHHNKAWTKWTKHHWNAGNKRKSGNPHPRISQIRTKVDPNVISRMRFRKFSEIDGTLKSHRRGLSAYCRWLMVLDLG